MSFTSEKKEVCICVLGNESCGKTSLISNICKGEIPIKEGSGCEAFVKETLNYKLRFWDVSGEYRYRSLIPVFLTSRTDVILLIYRKNNKDDINYLWNVFLEHLLNRKNEFKILLVQTHDDITILSQSTSSLIDAQNKKTYNFLLKHLEMRFLSILEHKEIYKTSIYEKSSLRTLIKSILNECDNTPIIEQRNNRLCCGIF